jgi:hypothetical protein
MFIRVNRTVLFHKINNTRVAINIKQSTVYTVVSQQYYLLTPWCRTLFEKLIVTQLVKKYPDFFI